MSFSDCRVTDPEGEVLFQPEWGQYDMAVGEHIVSVYPGSADRGEYDVYPPVSKAETRVQAPSTQELTEFALYQRVRDLRENGRISERELTEIYALAREQAPQAWLLLLELLELAPSEGPLALELLASLRKQSQTSEQIQLLVERGIKLLDNPPLAA